MYSFTYFNDYIGLRTILNSTILGQGRFNLKLENAKVNT